VPIAISILWSRTGNPNSSSLTVHPGILARSDMYSKMTAALRSATHDPSIQPGVDDIHEKIYAMSSAETRLITLLQTRLGNESQWQIDHGTETLSDKGLAEARCQLYRDVGTTLSEARSLIQELESLGKHLHRRLRDTRGVVEKDLFATERSIAKVKGDSSWVIWTERGYKAHNSLEATLANVIDSCSSLTLVYVVFAGYILPDDRRYLDRSSFSEALLRLRTSRGIDWVGKWYRWERLGKGFDEVFRDGKFWQTGQMRAAPLTQANWQPRVQRLVTTVVEGEIVRQSRNTLLGWGKRSGLGI